MSAPLDLELDRRLLPYDPKRVPVYHVDVLVVGGGSAGAAAALAAAEGGAQVALLTKAGPTESNTHWARGGLAAVLDPADSFEEHVADTLAVGRGLSEERVVRWVVERAPQAVERLLGWGARFDRSEDGSLELLREGGHGNRRILHAGDATGIEIQRAVSDALQESERVATFSDTFAVDLLTTDAGRVVGAMVLDAEHRPAAYSAREVVLATGGSGQVYRETTNPVIATGDGVALAWRAGAAIRDPEFFQFHPTCLYIAGAARVLISEIVRGAGGVLRDKTGARFMPAYHPDAELAPRDVVSRAAFERMVETEDTSVYLDLSGIEGDPHRLFPGISRICRVFGIDIATDPVPVRPGAHYMVGGVLVDVHGQTSVPGLRAVGECASTGLHGANRMGSNSLLECLVLGTEAGTEAASSAFRAPPTLPNASAIPARGTPPELRINVQDVTYSLKSLMWRQMGVSREAAALTDAAEKIAFWTRTVQDLAPPEPRTWELINMLTVAGLATAGAAAREESRGVHYRSDFPESREEWAAHTVLRPALDGSRVRGVRLERAPVEAPGSHLVTP